MLVPWLPHRGAHAVLTLRAVAVLPAQPPGRPLTTSARSEPVETNPGDQRNWVRSTAATSRRYGYSVTVQSRSVDGSWLRSSGPGGSACSRCTSRSPAWVQMLPRR